MPLIDLKLKITPASMAWVQRIAEVVVLVVVNPLLALPLLRLPVGGCTQLYNRITCIHAIRLCSLKHSMAVHTGQDRHCGGWLLVRALDCPILTADDECK